MRSASSTMRSISSWERRPLSFLMVILFSLPVDFSMAETLRIPLASMSKVTSICGWPRGMGGIPSGLNLPSRLLSLVIERSPSKTWMSTPGWLSAYVEKVCDFFAGTVVLRLISVVMTPPAVSRPRDRGVTSRSSSSESFSDSLLPLRIAACTVAPKATASSGLMLLQGSLPPKKSESICCTFGIRVDPPTSTTSCTCPLDTFESRITFSRLHALAEVVHVHVLETSAGNGGVEVDAVKQRVDLNVRLRRRRQGALCTLASRTKTAEGTLVLADVLLELALELLKEVINHAVVEVLTAKVGVAGRSLHFEDSLLDGEERYIERASAEVEDEYVLLVSLFVEAVRDGSGSWLVDDAKAVKARDGSGVLGCLALAVIEVGRHGDNRVLHLLSDVRLSDLLHLGQDHG